METNNDDSDKPYKTSGLKIYKIPFEPFAVQYAETHSDHAAAIGEWRRQKDQIKEITAKLNSGK